MWLSLLARVGYAAKGVVYFLVGMRAMRCAFEAVPPTGSSEAVERWGEALGVPFLVILGLGLLCFSLWRAAQVIFNPEDKGAGHRLGCALSGLVYGNLGKQALELALERPDPDDAREQEELAAFLFTQPLGEFLVAATGVAILGVGVFQVVKAWQAHFEEQPGFAGFTLGLARFGLLARGLVFLVTGGYVVRAAWTLNPRQVANLSEVLTVLKHDGGPWGLATVALGLMAYGLAMGVQARYYRVGHSAA